RRAWAETKPFDFSGRFYKVAGASSDVRPFQKPHPELLFGGASEGALAMGAEHCNTYAMYAEPLVAAKARIAEMRERASRFGREIGFNVSVRPIIAETEAAAWEKANRILAKLEGGVSLGWSRQEGTKQAVDNAGRRLMGFAAEKDVHDERLWMPITRATGALGNTSCLVGTPKQVADAMLAYYRLGVASFLIRGFDPDPDIVDFGRELIPRLKEGARGIDAGR
ncbi:MAG: LLM class flavin-dependent oxidoreductase, partial [Proteobacteria bacterium]|nr:LLM class flavin-dependent oxidoreductase [Pseudomonadota bacterium]